MRPELGSRLFGMAWLACAALFARTAVATDSVSTTVERERSVLQVRSTILAAAPAETCYAVLSDFAPLAFSRTCRTVAPDNTLSSSSACAFSSVTRAISMTES